MARYDEIGGGYAAQRLPEPTWQAEIDDALDGCESVVNVGAGTGNYEPETKSVVGVEPSITMATQRSIGTSVLGIAEALPFPDDCFDAAMAVLTVHHWSDRATGLGEMRRVAGVQVVVLFEPLTSHRFWLTDYFEVTSATETNAPGIDDIREHLDVTEVRTLWVPSKCRDGVAAAYWGRPEMYLNPAVQGSMSYLSLMAPEVRHRGIAQLENDLKSGRWDEMHGHLRKQERADYGYRLIRAES